MVESPRLAGDVRAAIIEAARLAPSGDNCQPFRYHWRTHDELSIYFDSGHKETFLDVDSSASLISLGTAIENVSLEAAAHGVATSIGPIDVANTPVVALRFTPSDPVDSPLRAMIPTRATNRRPYDDSGIPDRVSEETRQSMTGSAEIEWAVGPAAVQKVARLAATFDRFFFTNGSVHDEFFRWLRTDVDAVDGLPIQTLEFSPAERVMVDRVLRYWLVARTLGLLGGRHARVRAAARGYRKSGAFALVSVAGASPADLVAGGRAWQRAWLSIAASGYHLQPTTGYVFLSLRRRLAGGRGMTRDEVVEVEKFESAIHDFFPSFNTRTPIAMFRVGAAPPPTARAGRLPVAQLMHKMDPAQ